MINYTSTLNVQRKNILYKDKNKKTHFLGVIINLFLVVKPSSDVDEKKLLFGSPYIASGENGIWKNSLFLVF